MDIDTVINEYRNADESRRLSLFMAYRDLRDHFERIEDEDCHEDIALFRMPWRRKRPMSRAA